MNGCACSVKAVDGESKIDESSNYGLFRFVHFRKNAITKVMNSSLIRTSLIR